MTQDVYEITIESDEDEEEETNLELFPSQNRFVTDVTTPIIAYVGGFNAGKTYGLVSKAIYNGQFQVGYKGMLAEPTFQMIEDNLIQPLEEALDKYKITYKVWGKPAYKYVLQYGHGEHELILRSAENWDRWRGLKLAYIGIDEIDRLQGGVSNAQNCHRMALSRLSKGAPGYVRQLFYASTPEGYGFLYQTFGSDEARAKKDRQLIQACSFENPSSDKQWYDGMLNDYPPMLLQAYIHGKFVNLFGGRCYPDFDRKTHHTDLTLDKYPGRALHIGMDFNPAKMAAAVGVIDDGKMLYLKEHVNLKDTKEMINAIITNHSAKHKEIHIYPDSSGQYVRGTTEGATITDVAMLENAFGQGRVHYHTANPDVVQRIESVNAMILNGRKEKRLWVNTKECPRITEALEQLTFAEGSRLPDKTSGKDHISDAVGYPIVYLWPVYMPGARNVSVRA